MRRILADVKAYGKQYMRGREGAFFALAFPLILIVLFGAIFGGGGSSKLPLYVQDLDDTQASHAFIAALNNTSAVTYNGVPRDVAMVNYIREKSINNALVIPRGFQENVTQARAPGSNARVNITLYGDPTQASYGIALGVVNGVANEFNFQIAGARPVVFMNTQTVASRPLRYIDLFLPGVIGLTVLTVPLFGMTYLCADYRARRYFKLLATTSLTKGEWLASKVIFYSVLMLVSTGIMVGVKVLVFSGTVNVTPLAVLTILAGTVEFTAMGMIMGLFIRDVGTAGTVANAIGFPMMFLAGSFFPVDTMPPTLQVIARALPLTYVNEGLRATMVFGNEATALNYLLITVALAIALFLIPAWGLSWKSK